MEWLEVKKLLVSSIICWPKEAQCEGKPILSVITQRFWKNDRQFIGLGITKWSRLALTNEQNGNNSTKINNTDDQSWYERNNASYVENFSSVYETVVTIKGKVDIDNKNVVIPLTINKNNKKLWETIYEAIAENYFKERKELTDEFIQMWKTNNNKQQNIKTELNQKVITTLLLRKVFYHK